MVKTKRTHVPHVLFEEVGLLETWIQQWRPKGVICASLFGSCVYAQQKILMGGETSLFSISR